MEMDWKVRSIKEEKEYRTLVERNDKWNIMQKLDDEKDSMALESTVVKEEPMLAHEMDEEKNSHALVKTEPNFVDDISNDDDTACNPKNNGEKDFMIECPLCDYKSNIKVNYRRHVTHTHKRQKLKCEECDYEHHLIYILEEHRREEHNLNTAYEPDESLKQKNIGRRTCEKEEDYLIECPFCDYKSNFKSTYRNHVTHVHNRQEIICDGCDMTTHLIYILLEHRIKKHGFTHEYSAVAVPREEETNQNSQKEEEEIRCPLCDYKSNVKFNYQRHVIKTHKRQELQCEKCDFKHCFIYSLEKHRRGKHNLDTPYEADKSLKMKSIHKKCKIFMGPSIELNDTKTNNESYGCPLCSYKSIKLNSFYSHYKNMHKNVEMPCDGCSDKFHLYFRLLQHRKIFHNFDHPYEVPESIILEDNNRKEKRRLEKGQNYPCPQCDRWFTDKRYVAEHLGIVHKYSDDYISKVKIEESGTKINIMHLICDYCQEPLNTKSLLLIHMLKIHKFPVNMKKSGILRKSDSSIIEKLQNKKEYNCRYCPKIYSSKVSRKGHEVSLHTLDWQYSCDFCDKKFVFQFELKRHLHRHRGGKRLSCSRCQRCGENFTKKKLLERHKCRNQ